MIYDENEITLLILIKTPDMPVIEQNHQADEQMILSIKLVVFLFRIVGKV